jgi:hypothetical protein
MSSNKQVVIRVLSIVAIAFGLLTLKSGGEVLFVDGAGREAAGNFVAYVLWFNFAMGFFYVIAGIGLWLHRQWAVWLSIIVAIATLSVFAAFGMQIVQGGLFEQRTVGAMALRSLVWLVISIVAYRKIIRPAQA